MHRNELIWVPQPRQAVFMERAEDEALFGGAAGGGKSDAMVIEALRQISVPYYKGLLLRKTFPQLSELIDKSIKYYTQVEPRAKYNSTRHTWYFPSGAQIRFGSMPTSKAKFQYQGQAFDFVGFDELTHFQFDEYIFMLSRNRPNGPGTRVYMRSTANPGGIGHAWVKERFISAMAPGKTIWSEVKVEDEDGNETVRRMSRIFIPSKLTDNKALMRNDPNYIVRLASLPEAERKALLDGNWDSYDGQVFTEWRNDPDHYKDRRWTHVIDPFEIPEYWQIYRSMDWGYNAPFSVGWFAVSDKGVIYHIAELYGCREGEPNVGVKWTTPDLCERILEIERTHPLLKGKRIYGVADPAIWQQNGGPSIAETCERYRVYFSKGDHQRIPGWMQLHYRLAFDEEGRAMFYVFRTCRHFIRTFPALIYDETNVEDVDTRMEDHAADMARYMCMTRVIKQRRQHRKDERDKLVKRLYLDIRDEEPAPPPRTEDGFKVMTYDEWEAMKNGT